MEIDMTREEAIKELRGFIGQLTEGCQEAIKVLIPELAESEDERIRKMLIARVRTAEELNEELREWIIAYLERQKEQKPDIVKPHKGDGGNPYDMGVSEAQDYAINRGFGIPFNDGEVFVDERYITQTIGNILRWADEHPKEQKPDIELIQRFWYMEGYFAGKHKREPKWIMKIGEGGPKYEENPKNGLPLEEEQKPEWSEEDELMRTAVIQTLETFGGRGTTGMQIDWLKSIRPQSKQEWSKEDEAIYDSIIREIVDKDMAMTNLQKRWLRSLKNRRNSSENNTNSPSWKPSARQLMALDGVKMRMSLEGYGLCPDLQSLLDDLRKLM